MMQWMAGAETPVFQEIGPYSFLVIPTFLHNGRAQLLILLLTFFHFSIAVAAANQCIILPSSWKASSYCAAGAGVGVQVQCEVWIRLCQRELHQPQLPAICSCRQLQCLLSQ